MQVCQATTSLSPSFGTSPRRVLRSTALPLTQGSNRVKRPLICFVQPCIITVAVTACIAAALCYCSPVVIARAHAGSLAGLEMSRVLRVYGALPAIWFLMGFTSCALNAQCYGCADDNAYVRSCLASTCLCCSHPYHLGGVACMPNFKSLPAVRVLHAQALMICCLPGHVGFMHLLMQLPAGPGQLTCCTVLCVDSGDWERVHQLYSNHALAAMGYALCCCILASGYLAGWHGQGFQIQVYILW